MKLENKNEMLNKISDIQNLTTNLITEIYDTNFSESETKWLQNFEKELATFWLIVNGLK